MARSAFILISFQVGFPSDPVSKSLLPINRGRILDRLISIAIPRIRDFRGLSGKQFDGNGNYTFGLTEQLAFMEVRIEQVDVPRGMDITIVTTAKSDIEGKALLDAFGFPFRKGEVPASVTKAKKSKKK